MPLSLQSQRKPQKCLPLAPGRHCLNLKPVTVAPTARPGPQLHSQAQTAWTENGGGGAPQWEWGEGSQEEETKAKQPTLPKRCHTKNPLIVEMTELRHGELVSAHTASDCRRDSNPDPLTPGHPGGAQLAQKRTHPPTPTHI